MNQNKTKGLLFAILGSVLWGGSGVAPEQLLNLFFIISQLTPFGWSEFDYLRLVVC
ncbi:hypothetical protein [Pediococcus pentosaceus]|uniref:hypothetical protein n=1 Tax=Pediococcus pentosaceus TaxID=1255 RepID=UPI002362FEA8|nr:hypothetical protein [Pediococcus pentosaceus]MDD1387626.1 hypothetical protein [Pediococcus pentosaceus]